MTFWHRRPTPTPPTELTEEQYQDLRESYELGRTYRGKCIARYGEEGRRGEVFITVRYTDQTAEVFHVRG